jgi:hypothetical protein
MTGDDDGRPLFWALGASRATVFGPHLAFLVVRPPESEPLRIRRRRHNGRTAPQTGVRAKSRRTGVLECFRPMPLLSGNKFTGNREESW